MWLSVSLDFVKPRQMAEFGDEIVTNFSGCPIDESGKLFYHIT